MKKKLVAARKRIESGDGTKGGEEEVEVTTTTFPLPLRSLNTAYFNIGLVSDLHLICFVVVTTLILIIQRENECTDLHFYRHHYPHNSLSLHPLPSPSPSIFFPFPFHIPRNKM